MSDKNKNVKDKAETAIVDKAEETVDIVIKKSVDTINTMTKLDEYLNERIPFRAFKDNDKYKDDLIVIVNGKTWQIQRGVTVMIPRYVYLAIAQAERQKAAAARHSQMLEDQYKSRESSLT